MNILELIVPVSILDIEGFCESIAEVMRRAGLQCLSVMHQRFDREGRFRTGKTLLFRLLAADDRDRQVLLAEIRINVQHLDRALSGLLCCCMSGMPFLPPELSRAEERPGRLFPANDRAPLVQEFRKIPVGMHFLRIIIAEQGLGGRPYCQLFLQQLGTAPGDPRHFGRESLYVILFLLEQTVRNKQRHGTVLHAGLFEALIQAFSDRVPDRESGRLQDHTPLDRGIITKLRFLNYICIPLREIHIHGCDIFHQFFIIICHFVHLSAVESVGTQLITVTCSVYPTFAAISSHF